MYGFYIKIAKKQNNLETKDITFSLNLEEGHKIIDIDLIDNQKILFTINNNYETYAVIYDIETQNIKKIINSYDKR